MHTVHPSQQLGIREFEKWKDLHSEISHWGGFALRRRFDDLFTRCFSLYYLSLHTLLDFSKN
jgi:hypothetical protein